ncbi:MAG: hypothetical protein JSW27_00985 [Phycisphaerales bacterium]|nr:MAG: hypothetical protein JSW27_00985 [Phycisphaerales bacterium]
MTKKRTVLRSQKKRVFEMLREAGLEPADFEWSREQVNGMMVSRLIHRSAGYYFQFSSYEVGGYCMACPGRQQLVEYDHPKSWDEQENHVRNWAGHLRREIACPDPWSELAKYRLPVAWAGGEDGPNEAISGVEAQAIAQQLSALADRIEAESDASEEQVAFVRARLAYLAEAAMREKSRDWAYSVLGVCATLAMVLSLDEDDTRKLWAMVKERVGAFIHLDDHETRHPVTNPAQ